MPFSPWQAEPARGFLLPCVAGGGRQGKPRGKRVSKGYSGIFGARGDCRPNLRLYNFISSQNAVLNIFYKCREFSERLRRTMKPKKARGAAMDVLEVRNIMETYQSDNGETTALKNISFSVQKGQFVSIVGPSGCGKSTLLSIIAGLMKPTAGEVFVNGEKIAGTSPHIGYMLQRDNLLDWRTIYKNVLFGLEVRKMLTPETEERAVSLLKNYGLYEFRDKYPAQLSGGMRQRAALIRTLAISPDILLLDEAFSALDYQTRLTVTEDVYRILKKEKITTVMVTHDIPESISMGDRIVILSARPAVVQEILDIDFEDPNRTPLNCRNNPKFRTYFDHIWKELSSNETITGLSGTNSIPEKEDPQEMADSLVPDRNFGRI
jgi:NitT/TauT family transport system ATP-binding protein